MLSSHQLPFSCPRNNVLNYDWGHVYHYLWKLGYNHFHIAFQATSLSHKFSDPLHGNHWLSAGFGHYAMQYGVISGELLVFWGWFCKFHTSFDMMLSLASIFLLCSMSIDRFYAVCYPLHYTTKMTTSMIKQLLTLCWSAPTFSSFGLVLSKVNASGMQSYEILVACFNFCALTFNKFGGTVLFTTCFFYSWLYYGWYLWQNLYCFQMTCSSYQQHAWEHKGGSEKKLI